MTTIKIYKKNNNYYKLEANGHTGYDISGQDILCASISAIIQTGALAIKQVAEINVKVVIKEKEGYMLIELPKNINQSKLEKSNVIFETMLVGLLDIESGYSKYIKLEVMSNDN